MRKASADRSAALAGAFADLGGPRDWEYRRVSERGTRYRLFEYPAMMVPAMQAEILSRIKRAAPDTRRVLDPFCGSGTVLAQAMLAGLDSRGEDINPLAVLVSRVRTSATSPALLEDAGSRVLAAATRQVPAHDFDGILKWFRPTAIEQLSGLRAAIAKEPALSSRRFLWVVLAEVIRRTSNSRSSTFKLYERPRQTLDSLPQPSPLFKVVLERNLAEHGAFVSELRSRGRLRRGGLTVVAEAHVADARGSRSDTYDLVLTSPPYGDNRTTVPYGQASYLPLNWIVLEDIEPGCDRTVVDSTHEIDRRSLGGSLPRGNIRDLAAALEQRSPSLGMTLSALADHPRDRAQRVWAFTRDLDSALSSISNRVQTAGIVAMTLGSRRVGGLVVPLPEIVSELLRVHRFIPVATINRPIPMKRMAHRNLIAETMASERVVVYSRAA